jgi:hypothetical protein
MNKFKYLPCLTVDLLYSSLWLAVIKSHAESHKISGPEGAKIVSIL